MKDKSRDSNSGRLPAGDSPHEMQKIVTATSLFGTNVFDIEGEKLGEITDVLLNIGNGRIESVILQYNGFIGAGVRHVMIRLEALSLDTNRHAFIIDTSRSEFEANAGADGRNRDDSSANLS